MPSLPIDMIFNDKKAARRHFKLVRASINDTERLSTEGRICENIAVTEAFTKAHTVLMYYPTGSELSLLPLVKMAFKLGKAVAFPISNTEDHTLDFRLVTDLGMLERGAYGILAPPVSAQRAAVDGSTLCILPALAVDREGNRLGYGGGYYDRFLADFCGMTIVALPSCCVCESLPNEKNDIKVEMIITEEGELHGIEAFSKTE